MTFFRLFFLLLITFSSSFVDPMQEDSHVHVLIPIVRPRIEDLKNCIESLLFKSDRKFGDVKIHFGIDWNVIGQQTRETIEKFFSQKTYNISFNFHRVYHRESDISSIVNHMFNSINGSYFLRFNDDSEILSENWNRNAIEALRKTPRNYGIAQMRATHKELPDFQSQSFVSFKHKEIWGTYFPVHFKNWHEDNWITEIYPKKWRKIANVTFNHHGNGIRYQGVSMASDIFEEILSEGRKQMENYCESRNMMQWC